MLRDITEGFLNSLNNTSTQLYLIYFQILIFTIKESGCSGVEATAVIIAEHKEDSIYAQYHKAGMVSTSTQTERTPQADISTQTGDHDEEEAGIKISASEEDSLYASVDVIPQDVVDNQAAGIILEEVLLLENSVFENIVFRAEQVEGGGSSEINTALDETELQHNESQLNETALESEIFAENNIHELYSDLPEVVADCVRAVFAAVTEFPHFATITPLEPHGEEVITEDKNEGAEDMSADRTLIKTTGPESNAVTPEDGEVNSVPLQVYVPVMENTEKAAGAELDPIRANQDELIEELSFYDETHQRGLIEMDAAHEEVTAVDALAFQDTPELSIVGRVPNELFIFWGLPEDVMASFRPEAVQEAEPSPITVRNPAAETLQAAMEALSRELSAIVSLEPEMESDDPLKEEVIVPTTSEPLSGEQDANLSWEPCGIDFDKVNEDSKETFMLTMDFAGNPNLSDELIAGEEHPKNDVGSDDVEPTSELIANIIGADVNTEVRGEFIANACLETCEEAEASPAIVKSNAEEATNPVIEGPSQDLGAIASSGHEEDDVMQLDQEEDAPTFDSF